MNDFLLDLVEILEDNEQDLKRMVLGLSELLQCEGSGSAIFGAKVIELLSSPISDGNNKIIRPHRLVDGKLLVRHFLAITNDILHGRAEECLVRFVEATQKLLESEEPHKRRTACFLMCKMKLVCETEGVIGKLLMEVLQCNGEQFSAFIKIIESMEYQHTDQAVGTLNSQLPLLGITPQKLGLMLISRPTNPPKWMHLLCLRLLQEERIQVLREGLRFILIHMTFNQLCSLNLLQKLLTAININQLYDYEDPSCLTEEPFELFTYTASTGLIEDIAENPWNSVPLMHFILSIPSKIMPEKCLSKLCYKVRAIENKYIRRATTRQILGKFLDTFENFTLREYINFVVNFMGKAEVSYVLDLLTRKIQTSSDFENHIECFNKQSFEVFTGTNDYFNSSRDLEEMLTTFTKKLYKVPKGKHGWWRLILYVNETLCDPYTDSKLNNEIMEFYRSVYNVDFSLLLDGSSLKKIQLDLIKKLDCQTSEEKSFLESRCVDLYVMMKIKSWNQLDDLKLDPLELLNKGTRNTFCELLKLLRVHKEKIEDRMVLPAIVDRLLDVSWEIEAILTYADANLTVEECENIVLNLVNKNFLSMFKLPRLSRSFYLEMILEGEPTTGDERIEASCLLKVFRIMNRGARARHYMIEEGPFTNRNFFMNDNNIRDDLLIINKELSVKRYFESSEVHRKKIRIANALINWVPKIWPQKWSNMLWEALFYPNDLLGITIMYEVLVAVLMPSINMLLDKLKMLPSLKATQQESLLSVTHIFVLKHWDKLKVGTDLDDILTLLIPLRNESNNQTRLLAQLILHRLAKKGEETSSCLTKADALKRSIEADLGEKLEELQCEPRLLLPAIAMCQDQETSGKLLWITNAPFDECTEPYKNLDIARESFRAGKIISSAEV
ncbi:uncharacterized protein LOC119560306 [Drosophila subpulchrella]|uniref:uncharacterized protein LOC119560306 n=1 Tax=Drosophila subpulchrella TaxID=1486046 RepID=UPI0018A18469|nr:uncharacterized protein LOC119560306 [Drosophila subpulchrella]